MTLMCTLLLLKIFLRGPTSPVFFSIYVYILVYVNDTNLANSCVLIFADDVKPFRVIKTQRDTELFQNDLDNLSNRCR